MSSTTQSGGTPVTMLVNNVTTAAATAAQNLVSTTGMPTVVNEPIFLETKTAQCIAGIFVFSALFLTCQQVNIIVSNSQGWLISRFVWSVLCQHDIVCDHWRRTGPNVK